MHQPDWIKKGSWAGMTRARMKVISDLTAPVKNVGTVLQAEFQKPGVYTAQIDVTRPSYGSEAYDLASPVVRVTWSLAGQSVERYLMPFRGMAISGACEAVRIDAVAAQTDTVDVFPQPTCEYTITATVSPGTRGTSERPYFGIPILDVLGPGDDVTVEIAKMPFLQGMSSIRIDAGPLTALDRPVALLAQIQRNSGNPALTWNPSSDGGWKPAPADSYFLYLRNDDTVQVGVCAFAGIEG